MKRADAGTILGLVLLLVGALLLVQNLGILKIAWDALWAALFAIVGIAFLSLFASSRDHWWSAIPGFTLLALGALIGLQVVAPHLAATWGGPIFLGGVGLSFLAVYVAQREKWWAMIPAGVLLTLAAVAGISNHGGGREAGAVFLLGLALTFGLVYLLPQPQRRTTWALIPAVVFVALAVAASAASRSFVSFLWPVLLILIGLLMVYRARGSKQTP